MKAYGAIVGQSLVSLFESIAPQDRDDILDCLLRVDGVAGLVSREQNFPYWVYRYGQGLEHRGCEKLSPIIHQPQVISCASELESITFEVIKSTGFQALATQAKASLKAARVRDLARHFFAREGGVTDVARFQVVPSSAGARQEIILLVCSVQISGHVDTRDFDFWTQTRRDMVLRISGGAYRFDRDQYARHRRRVKQELGARAGSEIQRFEL
jgi:hypothetical protein